MVESSQAVEANSQKGKRPRSPAYPGINLQTAIDKIKLIQKKEGRNSTAYSVALGDIGYGEKSGTGWAAMAALLYFGLLSEEGTGPSRKVKLTEAGFRIAIDERDESPERDALIKEAAMLPAMHREMWQKYDGDLPSDANMEFYLKAERGFTANGAKDFIREFKSTLAFAGITKDYSPTNGDDSNDVGLPSKPPTSLLESPSPTQKQRVPEPPSNRQVFQFPVSATRVVALDTPFPLTAQEWVQLMAILNAMKPAIAPEAFTPSIQAPSLSPLTQEAFDLLAKTERGDSIPAFWTQNLDRIARENGIEPDGDWSPAQIIAALRLRRDTFDSAD